MLIVPRKRICTQQPQGAAQVDLSNPIAKYISCAFGTFGGVYRDLFSPSQTATGVINSVSNRGVSGYFNGSARLSLGRKAFGNLPSGAFLARVRFDVFNQAHYVYEEGPSGNNFAAIGPASNSLPATFNLGSNTSLNTTKSTWIAGRAYHLAITWSGTTAKIYIDGALDATLSISSTPGGGVTNTNIGSYNVSGAFGLYLTGLLDDCFVINRLLSDVEVRSLYETPWQIFRAPDSRIFVPTGAVAGGGDSLTASSIIAPPATVGSPLLSQKHTLSASSIATAPAVVASPAVTQRHSLSASAVSASPAVVGTESITQRHALTATAISAAPAVVGSPTLTEIVAGTLSALPIVSAPAVVGAPAIGQKHALSAGAISAGPATFGTPTLVQQHAFIAQGVTAGAAVVGEPALSEGGAVIFTGAPNGGGYSRAGENYTRPPQTNTVRH